MLKKPRYKIMLGESEKYGTQNSLLVIKDVGPWYEHHTITNGVEDVVSELIQRLHLWEGRKLYYYDSEGHISEIEIAWSGGFGVFCRFSCI